MPNSTEPDQQPTGKKSLLDSRVFQVCLGLGLAIAFLSAVVLFRVLFVKG